MTRLRACLLCLIGTAIPVALAGCLFVPLGSNPATPSGGGTTDCGNRAIILDEDNTGYRLGGQCPEVIITADNASVQARRIGSLEVVGDSNSVGTRDLGSVVVDGDRNALRTGTIGMLSVAGDGNSVSSRGSVGSLVLDGDGNSVDVSGAIGSAVDDGDGNSIRSR